jgi:hypothetical protein
MEILTIFANIFSIMSGRYRKSDYSDESNSKDKFIGSFEVTVPVGGRMLQANVRPSTDGSYYSVVLNGTFLAHIMRGADFWKDLSGNASEIIITVGNLIEEHLK